MTAPEAQVTVVLIAVFLAYTGQMVLNPVLAPLSREAGLAEWQVGATISMAAIAFGSTSPFWGRRSQSLGRRPVLLVAFTLGSGVTALFALVAHLGLVAIITGGALFALFVTLRGIGLGATMAAVVPTAQAYVAEVTEGPARVKKMAALGAMQAGAMVVGSLLGGALSALGLVKALIAVPILFVTGLGLIALRLRREPGHQLVSLPVRVSPFDSRVWPFLVAAAGFFTAFGFLQVITGFIVQDRLGLDGAGTGLITGFALSAAGIGMAAAQTLIVRRATWGPPVLLRTGGIIAFAGFTLLIVDLGPAALFGAIVLIGVGIGAATPGHTAGATFHVEREEQGGVAGLFAATTGLTLVIAPLASATLYGMWPPLPIVACAAMMALVTVFTACHRRFR